MKTEIIKLEHLQVIGYADVLPGGRGPAVVPPIFRDTMKMERSFVPPFRISGEYLIEPQEVAFAEVKALAESARATLVPGFQEHAQRDFMLWVGLDGVIHYEPINVAKQNLKNLHRQYLALAADAIRAGNLDLAEIDANIALAADQTAIEPDALIAACHLLRGGTKQVEFIRRTAVEAGHNLESFDLLLEKYRKLSAAPQHTVDSATKVEFVMAPINQKLKAALVHYLKEDSGPRFRSPRLGVPRAA